ncbi:MAG: MFS transporter [Actinobacteria bacterium]|nr:MFS transporter [Actinomycetota bacterium]
MAPPATAESQRTPTMVDVNSVSPPDRSMSARDPRRPWAVSSFSLLARTHAASVSGDALFAIGLAGSVFFSLDFNSARWRVALYLVLTIAPFAVAAPLIGPAIDRIRGGRRWIIVGSLLARAVLAFLITQHMQSLYFYPEAFGMLVLQKIYSISKSAVVPGTVHNDAELVEANSKLTVLSALAVVVAAVPGGILLKLGGGAWSVGLSGIVFVVGTLLALRLRPTVVAVQPVDETEREELRSAGIVLASSAMGLLRGIVGFLSFMLAFGFKDAGAPLWELGLVAAFAQFGFFVGAVLAPRIRRLLTEERILIASLMLTVCAGVLCAVIGGLFGSAVLSMLVGMTGSTAKQAFDSIVQRDAPDANRGRSFARFETRFQLVWVIGALVPIIIPIPVVIGFSLIAVVAAVALIWYLLGLRQLRSGRLPSQPRGFFRRTTPEDADTLAREGFAPPEPSGGVAAAESSSATWSATSGFAPPFDPTDPDAEPPFDPARRWMRRSAPLPAPVPGPRRAPRRGDGLLFSAEAWDDPSLPPPDQ